MTTFRVGDEFLVSAGRVRVRVVEGAKPSRVYMKPDLRIELLTPNGWVAVGMDLSFLLAEMHVDVENRLYPPGLGFQGGEMFEDHLHIAIAFGWEEAARRLELAKARKRTVSV